VNGNLSNAAFPIDKKIHIKRIKKYTIKSKSCLYCKEVQKIDAIRTYVGAQVVKLSLNLTNVKFNKKRWI
jgi:hypothetical protein